MGSDASYTTQPLELLNTQGFDYTRKTMKGYWTPSTTATDGVGSDGDTYRYENENSFASTPQRISNGDGQRHQNLSGVEVWVPDGQENQTLRILKVVMKFQLIYLTVLFRVFFIDFLYVLVMPSKLFLI